jgi:uncharacterized protein
MKNNKQKYISYEEFEKCVENMIHSEPVLKMGGFVHHNSTTCMDHSIYVAYISFCISKRLGLDYISTTRGALLHDLFLYNWREDKKETGRKGMHGFTHPRAALKNASKYFNINEIEKDIIIKHMWPLTIIPPKYAESLVVCLADKYCAIVELVSIGTKTARHLKEMYAIY